MRHLAVFFLFPVLIGCGREQPAAPASSAAPQSSVAMILFVGQEQACACTRARIDTGWAALEQARRATPNVPVERLQADTDEEKVEAYRRQKPMLTAPAVYLVDAKGVVLDMLQGELTAAQVSSALQRAGAR